MRPGSIATIQPFGVLTSGFQRSVALQQKSRAVGDLRRGRVNTEIPYCGGYEIGARGEDTERDRRSRSASAPGPRAPDRRPPDDH